MRLATKIEAILYLKAQPLSLAEVCEYAQCDLPSATAAMIELMDDYARRDSALELVESPSGFSLQLRSTYDNFLSLLVSPEISTGALRTLAAIALKTPILQTDLIQLRGSSAYQQVKELLELGLIRKRRQTDGRSYWLEVTSKFHQYFEIEQLSQLLR